MGFFISEKYRLELHWSKVNYKKGICYLENACFSGPVLGFAEQINSNDFIRLDFEGQYYLVLSSYYVPVLKWGEVIYNKDNTVSLKNCLIEESKKINSLPKLKNDDYLVIDTKGHEDEEHIYNLVYTSYVINSDFDMYKFNNKVG